MTKTHPSPERSIPLGIPGFTSADLHDPARLQALLSHFDSELAQADPALAERMMARRINPALLGPLEESRFIVALAPHVSDFLARLFHIEAQRTGQMARAGAEAAIFAVRKDWVWKTAKSAAEKTRAAGADFPALHAGLRLSAALCPKAAAIPAEDEELRLALYLNQLLVLQSELEIGKRKKLEGFTPAAVEAVCALPGEHLQGGPTEVAATLAAPLAAGTAWIAAALFTEAGRAKTKHWALFKQPGPMVYDQLVQIVRPDKTLPEKLRGSEHEYRRRDGFDLTDPRLPPREVTGEVHYCVICHEREKDSCSKGFYKLDPQQSGSKGYAKNPLNIPLTGCPLDEKISEMHLLRQAGDAIGAIALIAIDNPMLPGTGHRICNDCMRSCIYQKQEPVNIPAAETGVLTDLLALPFGFEIWSLLTRWNPLNARRPVTLPYNGKKILVVGMGPAGYTLAHYLLNEGFAVVGIDGLKIEPPDAPLTGADGQPPRPVADATELYQKLSTRRLSGFGGVSEYGITVRWDKNFLTLLHLNLARRPKMTIIGGVRFGGTLTIDQAWELGFDHIAIAAGAGRPTIINLKNNLIRGIRKASDFLMGLQLTGAYKRNTMANLQLRLPVVVVGGGLTAIDTATEALAYYPVLVEKTLERYEKLCADQGEAKTRERMDKEEQIVLDEFLAHGRAVRDERLRAAHAKELPDFIKLVNAWGGVMIAYRKRLQDAPAYRLNYEEVKKALEEGIHFAENFEPIEAHPDEFGALEALTFKRGDGTEIKLPARALLVAAGTSPNTTYEKEYPDTFLRDERGQFFKPHRAVLEPPEWVQIEPSAKGDGFFTSYHKHGKFISFFGDNHPYYAGNVVKAMASARDGYPFVTALFKAYLEALNPAGQSAREVAHTGWVKTLDDLLVPRVTQVNRLTHNIVEVVVRAPLAAKNFQPGQFYRLMNYEKLSPRINGEILAIEPLALTGAWVDPDKGLLSMIALELGVSSRMCAALRPGEPVIVMGPTGTPTHIPESETVLLAGGGLGNAVLFSIAKAMKARGNRVIYFAGYKRSDDIFKRDDIEAATDLVVFSVDKGGGDAIPARRPQDRSFVGNIVEAMAAYGEGLLGDAPIPLRDVTRMIVIGSDRMMAGVKAARFGALQKYFRPDHEAIGSINSPMQCMMKEICAQCLQKHVDPVTGKEIGFVFSCFNQDQLLDKVDFPHLNARLRQNTVQEKLTNQYFDLLLKQGELEMV
jgi:NADPH-dependent glutamate synthase beta subunit-like oxidoreductase/NAD(P)H-flavin reductase